MPRRRQTAVAQQTHRHLAQRADAPSPGSTRGRRQAAQTRRQRRPAGAGQPHHQEDAQRPTRTHVERQTRPRAHPEMVTVALRGPLAAKMRELAETTGLSLAKLVSDMTLVYEGQVQSGYGPGTRLARWREQAG